MTPYRCKLYDTRHAFTLIELLVVISIIAILASLAAWGVFAMIGRSHGNNTASTIKTVNKILQSHWRYVIEEADKEKPSPAVVAMAQPDPTGERAKVLWRKFRLMEAFPQSFTDITNPFVYSNDPNGNGSFIPGVPPYPRRYIAKYLLAINSRPLIGGIAGTSPEHETESAACLLLALSVSRGSNTSLQDQINFALGDTDDKWWPPPVGPPSNAPDGVRELVDGWGSPMGFFRFAWNNADLQATNPAAPGSATAKFADPTDNRGTLINRNWYLLPNGTPNPYRLLFEKYFHQVMTPAGNATFVNPVIVSAGGRLWPAGSLWPNGQPRANQPLTPVPGLGLDLSIAVPAPYIYSFNLRLD